MFLPYFLTSSSFPLPSAVVSDKDPEIASAFRTIMLHFSHHVCFVYFSACTIHTKKFSNSETHCDTFTVLFQIRNENLPNLVSIHIHSIYSWLFRITEVYALRILDYEIFFSHRNTEKLETKTIEYNKN